MIQKQVIALSCILIAGCGGKSADDVPVSTDNPVSQPSVIQNFMPTDLGENLSTANTKVVWNAITNEILLPSFLLFNETQDGTAQIPFTNPDDLDNPALQALNDIDGWSTTAAIDINVSNPLATNSPCSLFTAQTQMPACSPNVFLIPLNTLEGQSPLDPSAIDPANPVNAVLFAETQIRAEAIELTDQNILRINPLKPLQGNTLYLIAIRDTVQDDTNQNIGPSANYELLSTNEPAAYNQLNLPAQLNGLHELINTSENIAAGTLTQALNSSSITPDSFVYTQVFTTTAATQSLTALAHPPASVIPPTAIGQLSDSLVNQRLTGFYATQPLGSQGEGVAATPANGGMFPFDAELIQGAIQLPYYLTAPNASNSFDQQAENILASIWRPNPAIANQGNQAIPADTDIIPGEFNTTQKVQSFNVTSNYPFPKANTQVSVPLDVVLPSGDKPADGWPVIVMMHGLQTDRSALLLLANAMANACKQTNLSITPDCFASVLIDQPLHGNPSGNPAVNVINDTSALSNQLRGELPSELQNLSERHFNVSYNPATGNAENIDDAIIPLAGTMFINLGNFLNTRDNAKQAVVDQMNLLASLGSIDVDQDTIADFNTDKVFFVGHSLGGILGIPTVASFNGGSRADLPRIQAAGYLNPGSQLTRLLENSPSPIFGGPAIVAGLAVQGIIQTTSQYEDFFRIFQTTVDPIDPINFVAQHKASQTPVYLLEMAGDGSAGSSDQTVPNAADENPLGNAQSAPLAGTEPLIREFGATAVPPGDYTDGTGIGASAAGDAKNIVVRMSTGEHSTMALPAAQDRELFNDVVNHLATFFTTNGRGIEITNNSNSVKTN